MRKLSLLLMFIVFITVIVSASPEGANSTTIINESRRSPNEAASLITWAGNVTQLNIDGTTVTRTWSGFYGNISGTITLDNSQNLTLYDWGAANPSGEIYATTSSTINWSAANIRCWNFTQTDEEDVNLTEFENNTNINVSQVDGVDETFNFTNGHREFFVNNQKIDANTCPAVSLFNESGVPDANQFQEVILYDDTNDALVFTSLIENDILGFTNETMDFEMIVPEDGHKGDTSPTTYYFYVELE